MPSSHYLYRMELLAGSYPKRNFERNQLLDGSISLSPLYSFLTIDLHVRTANGPPPGFRLASS